MNNEQQELNKKAFGLGFLLYIGHDYCFLVKLCDANKEPCNALVFKSLPAVKAWLESKIAI